MIFQLTISQVVSAIQEAQVVDNTNYLIFLVTAVLTAITGYYALQTRNSVKALEESTKAQFRPSLDIEVYVENLQVYFKIVNSGKGSANAIQASFLVEELPGSEKTWESNLLLPEESVGFFIPTSSTPERWDMGHFKNNQTTLKMEWKCNDILREKHIGHSKVDVTSFVKQFDNTIVLIKHEPLKDISNAIRDLRIDLASKKFKP